VEGGLVREKLEGIWHCGHYLICISTLRLWRKCPAKARQSTGLSVA
jgi:hypothetical protein